jgi:hypothetical protein
MRALAESEARLNDHLERVFEPTFHHLNNLGYPGLTNPRLLIKSALDPATLMCSHDGTRVHYVVRDLQDGTEVLTLPDRYNGLGFKNLIYMVVELLNLHVQWMSVAEDRPPLHLIFVEEPEAHLHEFLERYLKLTHCDLFFADAAILVEGNVERLLMPQMIGKEARRLGEAYITILEIGGAFGYRFRSLIEFLGITTLIVTDIDSVLGKPELDAEEPGEQPIHAITEDTNDEAEGDMEDGEAGRRAGTACMVREPGAVSCNQTLIQWLPKRTRIDDLLAATPVERIQARTANGSALIRVSYQTPVQVNWGNVTEDVTGRTLEEAFVFENLAWCQSEECTDLKLRIPRNGTLTLDELVRPFLAITELAENGAADATIMSLAGHIGRSMMEHYSHVRMRAKRSELARLESGLMDSSAPDEPCPNGVRKVN